MDSWLSFERHFFLVAAQVEVMAVMVVTLY
jgi:hypothetical protein